MIWLERACIFLVISCPCALVISVPMGFFGGIDAAYNDFENRQKAEEIEAFAIVEGVDPAILREHIAEYEFTGVLNPGDIRDRITQPMPLLKKRTLVGRIVDFIYTHVDKFSN